MYNNDSDILERLAHPENEHKPHKRSRIMKIRNILNLLFIITALVAMICIGWHFNEPETPGWCYAIGIVAVIIKMCEAMLRMPGLIQPRKSRFDRRSENRD